MLKNFRDKVGISGIAILMIGVALLVFTFVSAYGFLIQGISIIPSENFVRVFGEALGPLIAACIRMIYLGVMAWISSLLTMRGITIIFQTLNMPATVVPQKPATVNQPKPLPPQKANAEKPKEEAKPPEPQIMVIPPESVPQPQPEPKEPQKNNSSPPSATQQNQK